MNQGLEYKRDAFRLQAINLLEIWEAWPQKEQERGAHRRQKILRSSRFSRLFEGKHKCGQTAKDPIEGEQLARALDRGRTSAWKVSADNDKA